MWQTGIIACPETGGKYRYHAKVYEDGSEYGIGQGRVSKLSIRRLSDEKELYNFDRGLDFDNLDAEGKTVLNIILAKYA